MSSLTSKAAWASAGPGRSHRRDIDGLRAVAILGVLGYHFGVPGFTGGYAGVDVFFVISGYLIANIIRREIDNGSFSLPRFYVRRIRRIVPALTVMLLVTTAVAAFLLFPNDFQDYGRSMLAVATATSNFFFARLTGYFDGAATSKPLLHTWSLSVEEQFYLVLPLLLLSVSALGKRFVPPLLALGAVASLAYATLSIETHPQEAFFQTAGRSWELLIGALLAYRGSWLSLGERLAEGEALLGALMIGVGYAMTNDSAAFPGIDALPICFGAAFVLHAGESNVSTAVGRVLSLGPVVGIGLISYSVYLWHWPLLVLTRYRFPEFFTLDQNHWPVIGALIAASLVLGFLSWAFVEQPFRSGSKGKSPTPVFVAGGLTLTIMVALSLLIIKRPETLQTWPDDIVTATARKPPDIDRACAPVLDGDGWPPEACKFDAGSAPKTVVWGDSHAATLIPNFIAHAQHTATSFIAATYAGCPPLVGITLYGRSRNARCQSLNSVMIDKLADPSINRVVLAARWALYAEGIRGDEDGGATIHLSGGPVSDNAGIFAASLEATVDKLARPGREIVIVASVPEQEFNAGSAIARHRAWGQALPQPLALQTFLDRQRHVAPVLEKLGKREGVRVVYPQQQLCDSLVCRFADGSAPLYWDTNHLNARGLSAIADIMPEIFSDAR